MMIVTYCLIFQTFLIIFELLYVFLHAVTNIQNIPIAMSLESYWVYFIKALFSIIKPFVSYKHSTYTIYTLFFLFFFQQIVSFVLCQKKYRQHRGEKNSVFLLCKTSAALSVESRCTNGAKTFLA